MGTLQERMSDDRSVLERLARIETICEGLVDKINAYMASQCLRCGDHSDRLKTLEMAHERLKTIMWIFGLAWPIVSAWVINHYCR